MNGKSFEFKGTAGGYIPVFFITLITAYIPIFGWPISMNYSLQWIADNSLVNGRKVAYKAAYGETLIFLLKNLLLVMVTFGIYGFWFVPKQYRFIADHASFADQPAVPMMPVAPAAPADSVMPAAPVASVDSPVEPILTPPAAPVM